MKPSVPRIALFTAACWALLATLTFTACAAAVTAPASPEAGLPLFLSQVARAVEQTLAPVTAVLAPYVPNCMKELAPPFLRGAVSLVMVGRGARRPPAAVNGAAGDEVLLHTTAKFIYAAGAITAELTLLKMIYREPYRNLRRNPMNRLLCSPAGFVFLLLLTAAPNDLVDTSLICIFFWKLSASVYTPAVVCGQLLRVYVAALVPRLPPLSAAYTAFLAYWDAAEHKDGADAGAALPFDLLREALAEIALTAVMAGAVAFAVAARRSSCSSSAGSATPREPESDGDDYYEE
ncbi:putative mitochondrial hypothetical protein [Leptomonas pyrrhocoris]|uniref:Uncharacterized protein n=1 Tax=Leptomonas pyrrhocoris TaxID=157538 RepID=A0A0N0VGV0_LEPPY|nr:putative mitochondrial hypothetical protein [Leptomonas pyrrhocoris]XP_015662499.1 putative mitochondrial hypothetical protein [Leptomonas pyrrhocoris]XP_015662500.1 putative mitochondrial hypothetical protein [Leptomonas pyrrhocoris]XP_015662501.1 putative mitochondrial hypothetical protein [Leptomonas pyrrhocoris]XP_015662502.1 putative mitochondrial hypothetical protein [Leptomonas pyrrhocoris]KPA84059.1 putative mitochondrial hypothetical protein [Leptomonas pyrrhocoris]KPA84060.1 puta|eukprot:XP_015662498.1 putative mitochondrial hypothetical protein [Leptomonas pyrrhocoris]